MKDVREIVREYVYRNFIGKGPKPSDVQPLFENGVIDSLGHLRLISFLEREFHILFSQADLNWENFDSIEKIANLVKLRMGQSEKGR